MGLTPFEWGALALAALATQQSIEAQKEQKKASKKQRQAQQEEQKRRGKIAGIEQRRENFARLRQLLAAQGDIVNQGGGEQLDIGVTSAIAGGVAEGSTQFAEGIGNQNVQSTINSRSIGKQNALLESAASAAESASAFKSNASTLFAVASLTSGFGQSGSTTKTTETKTSAKATT